MGLTAYLVYGLVLADVMTLKMSMTACFISGIFMAVFAITGVSRGGGTRSETMGRNVCMYNNKIFTWGYSISLTFLSLQTLVLES